ncbi:phospholipase C, phosphocholine-specific [Streptomyces sp. KM77-8]|uniref:phospholipase C n=1 Tax=Streptomyces haneummycinicus TaxID=3074435 RepID=A0AAT9HJC0_9ACTN
MPDVNRRRFLQLAGATTAFSALSASIERAAALPANHRSGSIEDVEHIVVLMQENRSFDHYFGSLRGVRGFGDPHPVRLDGGRSVWHQTKSDGTEVLPFRPAADDLGMQFLEGLPHSWPDGQEAYHNGKYDRWLPAKGTTTMAYLTREDIPFHYALADTFTVCDAYHCSFIGSTDPNRYYLWSGHTGNDGRGGGPVLGNDERGYDWTTYPERLEEAGISWKVYQDIGDGLDAAGSWGWIPDAYRGNYGDNSLLYFNKYRDAEPGDPLYDKARTGTDVRNGDGYFDRLRADVKAGRLPQVSWIAAPEAFSEHSNWPSNYGAWYISQVLDALTSDPKVWAKTALFITYDENDGFFDHVVPPLPPKSAAQGRSTVDVSLDVFTGSATHREGFYGLGPRVPMLVVSPWSKGGYVCSETFDHTSVIRFMERRFGVREPQISPWRRAICGDLTSAFDFSRRDGRPARLPDTDAYEPPDRDRHPDYRPTPPVDAGMPRQERGAAGAAASVRAGGGRCGGCGDRSVHADLRVRGTGGGGVPRHVRESYGRAVDVYDGGGQGDRGHMELRVLGRLVRPDRARSERVPPGVPGVNGVAGCEVTARHTGEDIRLTFVNEGEETVRLRVSDAYNAERSAVTLRPGGTSHRTVRLRASHHWYDLTITSPGDPAYVRRFAGHVETGHPSTSNPAQTTA